MTAPRPPLARPVPHTLHLHGDTRIDPYYWLRDDSRQDPAVLAHLQAENAYTEAMLQPTAALQQQLYEEMVARQPPEESQLPYCLKGYWYRSRFETGDEYPRYERWPQGQEPEAGSVQLLLDANQRAGGHAFYAVESLEVSPDQRWLACAEDWEGRRQYRLALRSLESGDWQEERIDNTSGELVWSADSQAFFYVRLDPQTLLPCEVWRHRLGTEPGADTLVYREADDRYYVSLYQTRSEAYVAIHLQSTLSSEVRLIPAARPQSVPQVLLPRQPEHEYELEHFEGHFYLRSNREGRNFGLYRCPEGQTAQWQTLLAPREDVLLQEVELFRHGLLVEERSQGQTLLRQLDGEGRELRRLQFEEAAYVTWLGFNPDPEARECRYGYSSLTHPASIWALDLVSGAQRRLRQQPVLGDFAPEHYHSERCWISAADGVAIPVSLVYRRELFRAGGNPLLIYGYGAYGLSEEPAFDRSRLSLLDRGFVFAIAHVRGGEELGRSWYEQGRGEHKQNSFSDFIAVTRGLVARGYGAAERVFAQGGSAGGLLMAAVINQAPELYRGVVAGVPFVDVLTSMLDESIPLTTGEYDEWGDPAQPLDYYRIKAYSPYDQVRPQAYPHLLVMSGLHDSQVQYWEPAKWVAKLRATKTDHNLLLLSMDLEAGHGGKSGRFHYYRDLAREYAFLLWLAAIDG